MRVSSNVAAIPTAVTPSEAVALLERMRHVVGHRFLEDDIPLVVGEHLGRERVVSYRQVTDAHLVALARRHEASLVTLGRGIAAVAQGQDIVVVSAP